MKRIASLVAAAALIALPTTPSTAQRRPAAAAEQPSLHSLTSQVSEARLRENLQRLVSFGTRHTLSSRDDRSRGIGAAQRWTAEEFRRLSRACGNCLEIQTVGDTVTAPRIPQPSRVENIIAIQRGTTDPDRVVIITGHIDSRVSDVMNATADSPGANDDGSGVAAILEAARVLSQYRFPGTIVYAPLAGEEQGLQGAHILARHAKANNWKIVANLNNDMIGNTQGQDGVRDTGTIRVFSEGIRADAMTPEYLAQVRRLGGENDAPSRNLSRWLDDLAERLPLGLDVRQIWRNDRFGRGGDHSAFLDAGFPAVRITEGIENYHRQHQDLRTENGIRYGDTLDGIDWDYLTRSTQFNVAALAALARAPMPPEPRVEGAVEPDTRVIWQAVPGASAYVLRWRAPDAANWQHSVRVDPRRTNLLAWYDAPINRGRPPSGGALVGANLPGIRIDDWVFGVSAVSADGYESPVASAVPGGAFRPYTPPAPARQ